MSWFWVAFKSTNVFAAASTLVNRLGGGAGLDLHANIHAKPPTKIARTQRLTSETYFIFPKKTMLKHSMKRQREHPMSFGLYQFKFATIKN
tara:strand:+ start:270 stop:542 length:273 start_codon:yes stop_codon:yes gene_type:complete